MAIAALGRMRALEHHVEDFLRPIVGLGFAGLAQGFLSVLGYFLQAAFVKLGRNRFYLLVGDRHFLLSLMLRLVIAVAPHAPAKDGAAVGRAIFSGLL